MPDDTKTSDQEKPDDRQPGRSVPKWDDPSGTENIPDEDRYAGIEVQSNEFGKRMAEKAERQKADLEARAKPDPKKADVGQKKPNVDPKAAAEGDDGAEGGAEEGDDGEDEDGHGLPADVAANLPKGYLQRLARAQRQAKEAKARATAAEERLEAQTMAEQETEDLQAELDELDPNDFDEYADYAKAKASLSRRLKAADKAGEKDEGETHEIETTTEVAPGVTMGEVLEARERVLTALEEADLEMAQKITAQGNPLKVQINPSMMIGIDQATNSVALIQHLVANPEESVRISKLKPAALYRELARLDLSLDTEGEEPPPATTTKASETKPTAGKPPPPDPITPTGGRAGSPPDPIAAAQSGNFKRYAELRDEEELERQGRNW